MMKSSRAILDNLNKWTVGCGCSVAFCFVFSLEEALSALRQRIQIDRTLERKESFEKMHFSGSQAARESDSIIQANDS